jgi:DNA helicase-2/ATP-dependent DNA helicase PcrA
MNLQTLNPEQRAAVEHDLGPLLLLAGAGSGKTRVITYRIAYLLLRRQVPASAILAMTFTNKAAREMRERVVELVGRKRTEGMIVATFHALCVQILKEDINRLGYKKNFSIYAAADQSRLIRDIMEKVNIDGKRFDADRILWLISDAKNRLVPPERFEIRHDDDYQQMAAAVYPRYQKALKAYNAVDFDDLIMLTVRLLEEFPAVLEKYRLRFRYLLVDEYQDTNAAQYLLLKLLAGGHRNLCVVGDDDQSIYGWRGADLGNILGFERDFPGTRVIKLEQNYRSTGNILAAANAVIRKNLKRKEKALWTSGKSGAPIDYILCRDDEDEARQVIERLQAACFRGRRLRDFAILYRTNVQSRIFEEQLRYENIPYVLIGGQQFFDRKEVKDVIAYLKVILNPFDEVNLLRILNYPKRGIGTTTADKLIRQSEAQGKPLWSLLRNPPAALELNDQALAALALFVRLIESFRNEFNQGQDLTASLRRLLKEIALENEIIRATDDPIKAQRRRDYVLEVVNAISAYQERERKPSLAGFLDKVSLFDDDASANDKEDKLAEESVTLMSLHSSKGLEFPVVFLVGMEEEFLPHKNSLGIEGNIEEERRLCYVGVTRAREQLYLLGAGERKKFGKLIQREPSRFLEEIPAELLQTHASDTPPVTTEAEQEQLASSFFSGIRGLFGGDESKG